MKAWRAANPHKIKRYSALYLEANRDQLRVKDALYRRMNPEWASAHRQLRRARERAVPGSYTKEELIALYVAQQGRCAYCGGGLNGKYDADHIIPLSRPEQNPTNYITNIACTCERCNLNKSNKLLAEWTFRWYELTALCAAE